MLAKFLINFEFSPKNEVLIGMTLIPSLIQKALGRGGKGEKMNKK